MLQDYRVKAILISLQSFVTIVLFFVWLITGNMEALYASLLFGILISIPVKMIKFMMYKITPKLSKRPYGAIDCHAFPGSGSASKTGMPSGHSAGAIAMSVYSLHYIWDINTSITYNHKIISSIIILCMGILIAYSRIIFKCHTLLQVLSGCLLGYILGEIGFYYRPIMIKKINSIIN